MRKIAIFVGSIALSLAAGAIGSLATIPNIPTWYASLDKPQLLPPNEVFGPVWTILYILIGIALALIITAEAEKKKPAYLWFGIQLFLNTLWSLIFFGLQLPRAAFAVILLLGFSIVMTMIEFRKINQAAFYLFYPYIVWVLFASYLNLGVAILN